MKRLGLIAVLMLTLAGCHGTDYDTRPIEGEKDCFQIQDANDGYKGLGTYCKVEMDR